VYGDDVDVDDGREDKDERVLVFNAFASGLL